MDFEDYEEQPLVKSPHNLSVMSNKSNQIQKLQL